ncbi:MAG: serine hydrolase domain-containing protein, partial [Woeseiaceae bacterium]|nr:serine hydrolase domain-containing protein [Woeseiaceae bacterium]
FDVASVTKQFTAASLSMLALEGRLALDDDVRKWLPELPRYEAPITLRHMIYHTSGLRDYLNLFPLAGRDDYFPISHPQILAMMSRQRALVFPPGERYLYSNTAYMLLAQVIERAAGMSFGEFARERIFEPLGMQGSRLYDDREAIIPQRATGYGRGAAGRLREVHNYNFDVAGDGQLYSTVEDLLRWDEFLHGAEPPAIHSMMLTEGTLATGEPIGYAQGIVLDSYRGLRTVGHSGSSWGFRSQLLRFVEPGLGIAIACNADFSAPGELALRVADHFLAARLGPPEPDASSAGDEADSRQVVPPPALTAAALVEFAGTYYSAELDATYRLAVVAGELELRIEQEPPLPVTPEASDRFLFALHPPGWSAPQSVTLGFRRDAAGALTGFDLSAGAERGILFEKR